MRRPGVFRGVWLAAAFALASAAASATGDDGSERPVVLRRSVVQIPVETTRAWAGSECGAEIAIPWFDGELRAVVDEVQRGEPGTTVTATLEAEAIGSAVWTIGDAVAGALTIDGRSFRVRQLADETFLLTEIDANRLMPDDVDTNPTRGRPVAEPSLPQRLQSRILTAVPAPLLSRIVDIQLARGPDQRRFQLGTQIDVLVVVTHEAAEWADAEGLNLSAEINNMFGIANQTLARSGTIPRLRPVATAFVEYEPLEPASFERDLDELILGNGALAVTHELRDLFDADLVSLLVFNGEGACAGDPNRACGRAVTPRILPGPTDGPDMPGWESRFAINGFSVVNVFAAFNGFTFIHEIGHNLGAHHDWFSFAQDGYAPTVDPFARGWILFDRRVRSVMAYNRLCDEAGIGFCELLPFFSNPQQSYFGERRGDPAPGTSPTWFGPADNRAAIDRMAPVVSSYRTPGS